MIHLIFQNSTRIYLDDIDVIKETNTVIMGL